MTSSCDVLILGGGIVGAACAMECALAGMKVIVVEADVVGGGATAAGMGHIVVMDDSPEQLALTQYSQQLWNQIAAELPDDVEYEKTGTIWVAANEEEMLEVNRKHALYSQCGLPLRILDAGELAHEEPNLRPGLAGGLLVEDDAVVYPPCAALYFLQRAMQAGARLISQTALQASQGEVVLKSGETLTAPRIVNALGASAAAITPDLPIRPRKGHLAITGRAPGFVRHQLVELGYIRSAGSGTADSVAFNVQPRKTGQLLIGSSRQYDANHPGIDHAILQQMLRQTLLYMPSVQPLTVLRTWTGFRAATADKLPLIGPHPQDTSLYLATGHEGLGITTSLATAKILRHIFTGSSIDIPIEPYLPSRLISTRSEVQYV
ncbi:MULTISPECIES: FAD-dependent oxidoreductase [Acidobacterium]|uniref:Oxidoreductase, FAD-dependent n=1 Tax=Acidobacterium capsulatum (strain ATCC 51196 / DSM 11244 / BCRC 80197 / JCM 7670 / NBRC 15755 / NCIMB 13165 / 161) TaxID=240015 RepID=C1F5T9_ACIC5|nr:MULTISPECIES: FAD-dependent oxidoreductase [Acidobacterium]ACO33345.1 oxidoreductase, FAD-dependent [Acidobacterium capsulatum ATCC 51196]HCT61100.1 FAD-binding oxidoreductase [Acidobacterium sp.]